MRISVRLKKCKKAINNECCDPVFLYCGFPYCVALYVEDWLKIKNTQDALKIAGNGGCMEYEPIGKEIEYELVLKEGDEE